MRFREKGSYLILPFEKFPCTIVSCSSQSASSFKIRMTPTLVCIILLTELSSGIPVKSPMQISTQAILRKHQDSKSAIEGHRLSERVERSSTSVAGGRGRREICKVEESHISFILIDICYIDYYNVQKLGSKMNLHNPQALIFGLCALRNHILNQFDSAQVGKFIFQVFGLFLNL